MTKFSKRKILAGLALGSGGAKGSALIGAIKAFEEDGIYFDVVAGTSIGSVVGALYAQGYSSGDMANLATECGFDDPTSLLFAAAGARSLKDALGRIFGGATFDDLRKPFCAVATNLDTGEEVDIVSGDIASALAGSSAIQPVFRAVNRNGIRLVDGAFVNSVPADMVKSLGANYVVSINLSKGISDNSHIKYALDRIYPENGVPVRVRNKVCYEYSDVVIEPELGGYSASSISKFYEMYAAGYAAAKEKTDEIKKALREAR